MFRDRLARRVERPAEREELRVPSDHELPRFHVPPRFRKTVERYAADLVTRGRFPTSYPAAPLLIIEGAPGEGKTQMTKVCLRAIGIGDFHPLPAAEMGGQFEGDASGPLKNLMFTLGRTDGGRNAGDVPGCILLDDFDQSVARDDDTQQSTTNSGMLNSALMNYADDPTRLQFREKDEDGQRSDVLREETIKPVLVILTVNDSGALYAPLRRPGRALRFAWVPSVEEKADMLAGVFGGLERRERVGIVRRFGERPIAFYEAILSELVHLRVEAEWRSFDRAKLFDPRVSEILDGWRRIVQVSTRAGEVLAIGDRLNATFDARSYLEGR